jgi:hypothetical protein
VDVGPPFLRIRNLRTRSQSTLSEHLDDGWECDEEAGGDGVEDGVEGRPVGFPEAE